MNNKWLRLTINQSFCASDSTYQLGMQTFDFFSQKNFFSSQDLAII